MAGVSTGKALRTLPNYEPARGRHAELRARPPTGPCFVAALCSAPHLVQTVFRFLPEHSSLASVLSSWSLAVLARAVSCWQLAGEDNDAAVVLCWPITLQAGNGAFGGRPGSHVLRPSRVSGVSVGLVGGSSVGPRRGCESRSRVVGVAARLTVVLWRVCLSASVSWQRWRRCWRVGARSYDRGRGGYREDVAAGGRVDSQLGSGTVSRARGSEFEGDSRRVVRQLL